MNPDVLRLPCVPQGGGREELTVESFEDEPFGVAFSWREQS